jgi:hypothetical protein
MPLRGYFTIADYPTCRSGQGCNYHPRAALAPDGNTVFSRATRSSSSRRYRRRTR